MSLSETEARFVALAKAGATKAQIASALGRRPASLVTIRHRIKAKTGQDVQWAGFRPKRPNGSRSPIEREHSSNKLRLGRILPAAQALPEDAQEWLVRAMPEGSTVADFAMSCVLDAYHEEQEAAE